MLNTMLSSKKEKRIYTNVYVLYMKAIPNELFRPQTFTLDKRKKWWICSKLIIEKRRKMVKKCVLRVCASAHTHARTRGRDQANKYGSKHNRTSIGWNETKRNETELDFGLEENAKLEWENENGSKSKICYKNNFWLL